MSFAVLFRYFAFCVVAPTSLIASEIRDTTEKEIILQERTNGKLHWDVRLGLEELKAGNPVKLEVTLVNKCNRVLRFDGFESNCRCTIASKTVERLRPNSSEKIEVELIPQEGRGSAKRSVKFELFNTLDGTDRLSVVCDYKLSAFLDFSQPQYQIKLREWDDNSGLEPIRLPFTFTKPNLIENLRVHGTGAFEKFTLRVEAKDGVGVVLLPVTETDIPKVGLHGNIHITDSETKAYGQCQLIIKRLGEFEFSPQNILMVLDDDGEQYSARGIFVLNASPRNGKFLNTEKPLDLKVKVASDFGCKAEAKRMDVYGRVHRIELNSNSLDEMSLDEESVTLFFACAGKTFEHRCKVRFLK